MRVAALYDIHGNLPALEAVLDEVRDLRVDRIVVGGDVVPGPMPRECLETLLDLSIPVQFIVGNGEVDLLAFQRGETPIRVPEPFHGTMRWVAGELPPEYFAHLAAWPLTSEMNIPGLGDVLFCHATPRDENEIFTKLTPELRLRSIFEATEADLVVCGHTHMQFERDLGDLRIVNAGSVGLPFGAPGADWALLGPDVELHHTAYHLEAAADRITATAYPRPETLDVLAPPSEERMLEVFEPPSA